ncbi:MAG TPA: WYL domain-containing protein [Longimicrobiales bacterium]|nr:WYL domain-containing protein [Longimicrobiales bacterium]
MDRSDRLDLMLRTLRDRPGVTAAALAEELGTSVRSVFRDIARLRDRGYPIESSRGRGGGLRLRPDWGLGRVVLAPEEALGVLLSLALTEQLGLPMFGGGLGRARKKLIDAFPSHERRRLTPLRERILVGPPAAEHVAASYRPPEPGIVRAVQSAFVSERVVHASYTREDGTCTERRLEPHAILLKWPVWYLLTVDHLREDVRTFRLDRFGSVRVEPDTFRPRPQAIIARIRAQADHDPGEWHL